MILTAGYKKTLNIGQSGAECIPATTQEVTPREEEAQSCGLGQTWHQS